MGVDAMIFIHTTDGGPPLLDYPLVDGLSLRECDECGYVADGTRPTHEVGNLWRYYGHGYERGPWPEIAAALMHLLSARNVDVVWYGGDCGTAIHRFDEERLADINSHWIKNGCRPYREAFA